MNAQKDYDKDAMVRAGTGAGIRIAAGTASGAGV